MTKNELIIAAAIQRNLTAKESKAWLNVFLDIIMDQVALGDTVNIENFGIFTTATRKSRVINNPRTQKRNVRAPKVAYPLFKPGRLFRKTVDPTWIPRRYQHKDYLK